MDYSLINFYAPYNALLPCSTMEDINSYNHTPTSELHTLQWHDDHQGDNIPTYDYAIPSDGPSNLNSSQKLYVSDATHRDYANKNPYATVQGKVVDDFGTSFGNASSNATATGFNSSDNSILDPTDWSTPDQDNGCSTSLGYFDEPQPSDFHSTDTDITFSDFQEPSGSLSGTCDFDFSAPIQYPVSPTSADSYEGIYVNHGGYVSAPTVHTADWSVNGNYWTRDGTTYPAHADIFRENASFPFIPADADAQQLWNAATSNPNQSLYFNGTTANGAPNPGTMYAPAPLQGLASVVAYQEQQSMIKKVFQSLAKGKRNATVAFDNEASNINLWSPASDNIGSTIETWGQQMGMISASEPANSDVHNNAGSKTTEIQGPTSLEGPFQAAAGRSLMVGEQYEETLRGHNHIYKIDAPGEYNRQGWSNLGTMSSVGEGSSLLPGTCPSDTQHSDDNVHGDDDKVKSKKSNTRKRARKENEQPKTKKQIREKTVFCLKCGEGFTTVSDLKRHERQVEDGEKIVCEYCHRSYSRDTPRHLATKVCRAARAALAQRVQEEKGREMLEQIWIDLEGLMER
ncbi:hypothetical protein EW146_g9782 [Bondarzewia mesenterica]|uniref:C2H2-type domain-containing protein n=1 Tax=Bondarzewia mesenterica TaxID=1095465 RepID=A0A4S4L4S8_9AGAM|nr:hypothetical protein EW146_g9782 [Bondarzewia mesenterica]